ncbi:MULTISPECIES: hypothetical protein [Trichocoleus]|uniref:Uncharacterized protein n=2 Tax=Trichocoleus TaxID=450526 RepID=A0ABV0JDQ0_9CYAN|nr:hypothetical protein [Trichocoleus sp. FACHB-46]MBD1861293.1 hypothetical protein [Trichocoleus sp. FACHB-46]
MPHRNFDSFRTQHLSDLEWPANPELQGQITELQNSYSSHYKLLNVNAWAIAKTMDKFYPGFWNRFMANRQVALQQFLEQKRQQAAQDAASTPPSASLEIPETSK